MSETIRVVGAAIDTSKLTLYKDTGETVVIPQGDPRIRKILDTVIPEIKAKGFANINLMEPNHYAEVEKSSNGLVRFFRVAKEKLAKFFSDEPSVVGDTSGKSQVQQDTVSTLEAVSPTNADLYSRVVDEIMAHAKPAVSSEDLAETDTVVAVVGNKVVPDAEKLKVQVYHASSTKNAKGLEAFLLRVPELSAKRRHSAKDLMRFMERGDLPLADDGSIIVYKVLKKRTLNDYPGMGLVDCHTGKVPQGVGVEVRMDESLVDPNRSNECSNGLHIARRDYIRSFTGDVCVLARIKPEDVIAVPQHDANKMRVCAYEILAMLTPDQYASLNQGRPITDTEEGQALLAKAIAGDFPPPHTRVVVGGHKGTNISLEKLSEIEPEKALNLNEPIQEFEGTGTAQALNIDSHKLSAPAVNPLDIQKEKEAVVVTPAVPVENTPTKEEEKMISTNTASTPNTLPATAPVAEETKQPIQAPSAKASPREKMAVTLERFQKATAEDDRHLQKKWAREAIQIKRDAKKSWGILGVSDDLSKQFAKLTAND